MKKTISLFLSVLMVLTMLIVPISVSAENPDWDAVLDDRYVFDFTNEGYYADQELNAGQTLIDAALPWHYGAVTFDAGNGRGNRSIFPNYSVVSTYDWGPQSWSQPGTVEYEGETYNTLNVYKRNESYFVPLKEDGTPFELAPGHTYTLKYKYYINYVEDGKAPFLSADLGLSSTGVMAYDSSNLWNKVNYGKYRFGWLSGKVGTMQEGTLTIKTTSLTSDANYNAADNTYTLGDYTLYNYLYFSLTNGMAGIDFISLEIVRDDYTPDWDAELEDKYVFDFSDVGYYSDVPNKDGQTTLDSTKTWTYAPVSIDPGLGRANRNIYPTYGNASTLGWGPQVYSWPESIVYNGVATDTMAVKNGNPGAFMPLKEDGTPLELVPGHSYNISGTLCKKSFDGTSNGNFVASAGYPSGGYVTNNDALSAVQLCIISVNSGSEGEIINFNGTLTVPATTDYSYNASNNTFTKDSKEYFNYLFFQCTGYPKAQINLISLEVTRDDYVAQGTVEYIDADGKVLKTVTANVGDYTVDYTLEDTADKVFAGWYLDENYNTAAGSTVTLTEAGVKLYAKWREVVDWSEELSQYYKFDISSMGNYSDVPNKTGQTTIDSTKTWTYAPVSINPGYGRDSRNIYPTYGNTSLSDWGPQNYAYKTSTTYNGETVDAVNFTNRNPGFYMPLKEDGTPFEFAPGHTYKVKYAYEVVNIEEGNPILQVASGSASDGAVNNVQVDGIYYNTISINRINNAWLTSDNGKGVVEKTCSITIPAADDERYNALDNTYTLNYNGVDYTLYNYLYFHMGNYGKASVNFVSIEVSRDDYVTVSTVNYVEDANGTVKETRSVNMGEDFAIDYIPENTAEKYFAGWYLDEALTQRVTSATVNVDKEVFNLYAKWDTYKDSITTTNPGYYYGTAYVPHFYNNSSTGTTEYRARITTRSHNSQTTYTSSGNVAKFSTTYWMDGMLITATDDTTGELFRAENNTAYRVSLKFRINAESTREDGMDLQIMPGAGLTATSDFPGGKYFDENTLKSNGATTIYTNEGVTPEGELLTYSGIVATGEFDTLPVIGVSVSVFVNAEIEIYELKVEKLYGEEIVDGNLLVSDSAANNQSYRIDFNYVLKNTLTNDIGIGFKTLNSDGIGYPTFIEGENTPIYTISAEKAAAVEHKASVLLTTDMYASVVDGVGCDDTLTALNSCLYGYIIGEVDTDNLIINNISITALKDTAGNDLIGVVGGQYLISDSEQVAGCQAIRYSFTYDSRTGNEIYINGATYTVKERGFIYANGNNYLGENELYTGDMNVTNATGSKYILRNKTTDLSQCWSVTDVEGTDYYNVAFSTYVTNFDVNDERELMVKAYVVVEAHGQEFTLYSGSINRSIAYMKESNGDTINPNIRKLVWGYDFSKVRDISEVTYFHQNHNQNSFNTKEGDTRNAVVGGKNLVIEDGALVMKITNSEVDGKKYDIPMTLSTRDKMSFKYGYLEIEAEIPFEYAVHSGFWMVPQNGNVNAGAYEKVNAEFNIVETDGIYNAVNPADTSVINATNVSNLHKWYHYYDENNVQQNGSSNIKIASYNADGVTFTEGLFGENDISDISYTFSSLEDGRKVHKYGVEWNAEYIAYYIDGVEYFRTYISEGNDFYNPAEGHENSIGMDCFHEEQNIIFTLCPRWDGYHWAYGGDLNNADYYDSLYENGILDVSSQGGDSIDLRIHSIKLYQREGETLTVK